jgi:aspartyl-tRNA(Asn)/glutamyl-tRNA(Gln) amidotransferase subunit A
VNSIELGFAPATELIALMRRKALSPVELTRAVLARIEQANRTVNAFCTLLPEPALAAAKRAEEAFVRGEMRGPLQGLPVSIKDLAFTKGVRSMFGSFIFEHRVPDAEPPFVRRLWQAGAVFIGKTTTPEFGWKATGDSPLTGITRNPWNLEATAGGSSSGAAAAAALGLGPLHHGSDGAGSIRIPSSFCGVFGLKPSYGRVPMWPVSNNDNTTHHGPITRTVADAALMLSVMAGPDEWDRTSLEGRPADYVGELDQGVKGRRIAFSPNLDGLPVDAEVASVVRAAARAFEDAGAVVEEVTPGFTDLRRVIRVMWSGHMAGNYGPYVREWGARMDPGLVACIEDGVRLTLSDYIDARARKLAAWDSMRPLWERFDLLLTPTVSVAALPVGRLNPAHFPQHAWDWLGWAEFSYPFNFTGQPAATVPAGFTPGGLPVGLQIIGRRFADLDVLQAAAAFERARPWSGRRPRVP